MKKNDLPIKETTITKDESKEGIRETFAGLAAVLGITAGGAAGNEFYQNYNDYVQQPQTEIVQTVEENPYEDKIEVDGGYIDIETNSIVFNKYPTETPTNEINPVIEDEYNPVSGTEEESSDETGRIVGAITTGITTASETIGDLGEGIAEDDDPITIPSDEQAILGDGPDPDQFDCPLEINVSDYSEDVSADDTIEIGESVNDDYASEIEE